MRRPVRRRKQPRSDIFSIPFSSAGLVVNQSRAAAAPNSALVLRNIWPSRKDGEVRGGLIHSGTIPGEVQSLFTYVQADTNRMFAADATGIYDVTDLDTALSVPAVSGRTSGEYSTQQVGTIGGDFLFAANGTDNVQVFDGATWADASITGVPSDELSHVWLSRFRVFFIRKNSLEAYYLPVDAIAGAASRISLGGVFQKGGSLLIGATWSLDAGDGIDDKVVFITTEGEVAIFEGADPGSVSDWRMVGLYEITKPLGRNAIMQAGGDLIIATVTGLVPLSEAIQKDSAALSLAAISRPIEPLWADEVKQAVISWQIAKWPARDMALITTPNSATPKMLAVSLETGAWAEITGWAAMSITVFNDVAYIGRADGKILACDQSGSDDGENFTAQWVPAYRDFGSGTSFKTAQMCRASFLSDVEAIPSFSVSTDYETNLGNIPSAAPNAAFDKFVWGSGDWGVAVWGRDIREADYRAFTSMWESVAGQGYALTPALQITSGGAQRLNIRIVEIEISIERGGIIV